MTQNPFEEKSKEKATLVTNPHQYYLKKIDAGHSVEEAIYETRRLIEIAASAMFTHQLSTSMQEWNEERVKAGLDGL